MSINDNSVATLQCNDTKLLLLPGNIIPHEWYKTFAVKNSPDLTAIAILADLVAWWRNSNKILPRNEDNFNTPRFIDGALAFSYEYFSDRFGFSKEIARKALVRLEEAKVLLRKVINIQLADGSRINKLNITLDHKFFKSCFRSSELDIRAMKEDNEEEQANTRNNITQNPDLMRSPQIHDDHISNKNLFIEYRSSESNFDKFDFKEKQDKSSDLSKASDYFSDTATSDNASKDFISNKISKAANKFSCRKRQPLSGFHPLNDEDAAYLRRESGRNFNLNYINKLILRLDKERPENGFYTKDLFMKYMTEALKGELREEEIVNRETFNFKADAESAKIERYLSKIEGSLFTCRISQLKRKIVAVFEPGTAYRILTSCWFKDEVKDHTVEIVLRKKCELNEYEDQLLLAQIRAVFGSKTAIEFIINSSYASGKSLTLEESKPELNFGKEGTIWNKVSKLLFQYYGEALHKSWFSRLEAVEIEEGGGASPKGNDTLILKAPSNFIKDWIKSNYLVKIHEFARVSTNNFQTVEVEV